MKYQITGIVNPSLLEIGGYVIQSTRHALMRHSFYYFARSLEGVAIDPSDVCCWHIKPKNHNHEATS